ncbi:MAG: hypothetical protein Q7J10_07330 [Methanosarcinaceae archaeon]|nr:hypothetical protein [Methanosarcinaceae archaeon]
MTEIGVLARIPDYLDKDIEVFMIEEHLDKSTSIRKLLAEGLQHWKKKRALRLLEERKITFLKAAEMSETSIWELVDIIREKGIVWVISEEYITRDIEAAVGSSDLH